MQSKITPAEAGERLKLKGIKPSVIRIRVLQYLMENRTHPAAEVIHRALLKEIPTLSKTSIYNTLKTLSSKSMILEIMTPEGEVRFDGYPDRHAHFMCISCGKIQDVGVFCQACKTADLNGAVVLEESIYLKGHCSSCKGKDKVKNEKNNVAKHGGRVNVR